MHSFHPEDLGDGYTLRWGTPADAEGYANLAARSFKKNHSEPDNEIVANYARDLLSGTHPLCPSERVAVVVDANNHVVAAAALMDQPLMYAGIPLAVGRPEIVVSDTAVRKRGFIRQIMRWLHAKSAENGDIAQAITGIEYYYKQFGYEWMIDFPGGAKVLFAQLPALASDAPSVTLRAVTSSELPQFISMYDVDRQRPNVLVTTPLSAEYLAFTMAQSVSSEGNLPYFIVNQHDHIIGYLLIGKCCWQGEMDVRGWGLVQGIVWKDYLIPIMHALLTIIPVLHKKPGQEVVTTADLMLDTNHVIHPLLKSYLPHTAADLYVWYIRVADLVPLLQKIAPVLDTRLAQSAFAGYSGTKHISFFRGGIALTWQQGQLTNVCHWQPPVEFGKAEAYYPPGIMAQQIFGWRSLSELRTLGPDIDADNETSQLLEILFPKTPSWFLWSN
jgi:hypothetical protein